MLSNKIDENGGVRIADGGLGQMRNDLERTFLWVIVLGAYLHIKYMGICL